MKWNFGVLRNDFACTSIAVIEIFLSIQFIRTAKANITEHFRGIGWTKWNFESNTVYNEFDWLICKELWKMKYIRKNASKNIVTAGKELESGCLPLPPSTTAILFGWSSKITFNADEIGLLTSEFANTFKPFSLMTVNWKKCKTNWPRVCI